MRRIRGHHGDDLGTQVSTFFSEQVFVDFLKPRLRKLFDVYHDAGIPVQMHSCGKITPFIPHLIDIGLDVLEPVQSVMDHEFLKREYGKDLIFYGGVDTQGLLAFGTPEEIYEGTLHEIDVLGAGGGYIAGPAQEIMDNVPPENVDALVRAIRHGFPPQNAAAGRSHHAYQPAALCLDEGSGRVCRRTSAERRTQA